MGPVMLCYRRDVQLAVRRLRIVPVSVPSSWPRASPGRFGVPARVPRRVGAILRDPKRLRRTHKLMKAYGEPWQHSVFYCTLKAIDRVRLENGPREVLN